MTDITTGDQVQHLDPRTLLVDTNVRHDAGLTKDFIASIRDLGVLVPIVAVLTEQGDVRVRLGHRRTLAAVEAARATVPVLVAADEATDEAGKVQRLIEQHAENEHRSGLSNAEQVDVVSQLAAFGVSAAQITKRTKIRRSDVDAALAIGQSETAKAVTEHYDFLDLGQAAVIAEMEDDPDAVKALVAAAKTGQFNHVAQRLRDTRETQRQHNEAAEKLHETGVTVIDQPTPRGTARRLTDLIDGEGTVLTTEAHTACPGHAAFIATVYGWIDPATGAPLHAGGTDDDDENDDDDEGDDGEDNETREWGSYLSAQHACTDPAANGHSDRWGRTASATAPTESTEVTPEQQEAARAQRRDVIDSNKAWKSAETVRRDWLRTFLARKTAPKGTAALIGTAVALDADVVTRIGGNHLAADLLGCKNPGYGRSQDIAGLLETATEARAQVIALAVVLAGYEDSTHIGSWRNVSSATSRYLTFLADNGYTLSNVERRACGQEPLPIAA